MIDGQPSQTAVMVAIGRAWHYLAAPEPKILRDNLAMGLAGFKTPEEVLAAAEQSVVQFEARSNRQAAETLVRQMQQAVCLRSRLVEEQIHEARTRGLKQFVLLGAGLDSTAYRCPDLMDGLDVFEVDHPSTQGWKRQRLTEIGADIPGNLRFVSFDFEHQTLADALQKGGVDKNAMTLFSWLGVQPYLTEAATLSTLKVLSGFARGSELVMDFVLPDFAVSDDQPDDGVSQLSTLVKEAGEPFLTLYTPDDLDIRLKQSGFSAVTFFDVGTLMERFLGKDHPEYPLVDEAVFLLSAKVG